jgi:N-acetylneuraminate lyase
MNFRGIIPALMTPFDTEGHVCEEMVRRLVDAYIRAGVNGLYICGGSGEGILLEPEERKQVAAIVTSEAKGRVPVLVHVGSTSTPGTVDLAMHAESVGADGVSSVPPFYYGVSHEGIGQHYASIATACSLPLILYNIPSAVHVTVTPAMMSNYMQIKTVVGIKFSSYNLFELWGMLQLDGGRLTVLSGNDEVLLGSLAMGAHGAIGLTLNLMPSLYLDLYRKFRDGDIACAQQLQGYANQVISVLLRYPVIPAAKLVLHFKGYDCGPCRGPLETLTDPQQQALHDDLSRIGFFEKDFGL